MPLDGLWAAVGGGPEVALMVEVPVVAALVVVSMGVPMEGVVQAARTEGTSAGGKRH